MTTKARVAVSLIVVLFVLLVAGTAVLAQSTGNYDLSWTVTGGGSGTSASAGYRVQGTAGQTSASTTSASGADYQVQGGFWVGVRSWMSKTYLPLTR